jgi:hypothetical protein
LTIGGSWKGGKIISLSVLLPVFGRNVSKTAFNNLYEVANLLGSNVIRELKLQRKTDLTEVELINWFINAGN